MIFYTTGTKICRAIEKELRAIKVEFSVVRCVNKIGNKAEEYSITEVPFMEFDDGVVKQGKQIIKYLEEIGGN